MAAPKFLTQLLGVITEKFAAVVSTPDAVVATNASGKIDLSFMPTGIGPDTAQVLASEALADGDLVNIWNNAGVANVRKATAAVAGKEANGFVLAGYLAAAMATVYREGEDGHVTALAPGSVQFLSVTPGLSTDVPPSGSGQVVQRVGVASSAVNLLFGPNDPIVLA